MSTDSHLPKESESQLIGQLADKALHASAPVSWRLTSLEGTSDFGLDYQVQIVREELVRGAFRLQLKGTVSPAPDASGSFFSVPFKRSTLNYYDTMVEPVLLVLCDLSVNPEKPSECPLYFVWAHDEISRLREVLKTPTGPKKLSVRFPKSNRLSDSVDPLPILERLSRLQAVALTFDNTVASAVPEYELNDRAQLLNSVTGQIHRRGKSFIDAMSAPEVTLWPEAPKESIAGRLTEIQRELRIGRNESAGPLFEIVERELDHATQTERAEFWYLKGKALSLDSDDKEAARAFNVALESEPSTDRYLVAWAESEFRSRHLSERPGDLKDLIDRLNSSSAPEALALLARLLAVSGQYKEAKNKLASLPRNVALNAMAIVAIMESDSDSAIALCGEGLADHKISEQTQQVLHLLRARAHFNKALKIEKGDESRLIVPPNGFSDTDIPQLYSAWEDICAAAKLMRKAGWPPNTDYLADIWAITAIILGRQDEVLPDLQDAARQRPRLQGVQVALERVAFQCGNTKLVLEALGRLPENEEVICNRIAVLFQARLYADCLALVETKKTSVSQQYEKYPFVLVFGILSADQLVKDDVRAELHRNLQSRPEWSEHLAVVDYLRTLNQSALARDNAVRRLEEAYARSPKSRVIGTYLFQALDAGNKGEARKCIAIAGDLQDRSLLSLEDTLHLAQAYISIGQWNDLSDLIQGAIKRFGRAGRLVAIRAFALDKIGQTSEAIEELRALLDEGVRDAVATKTYIGIVTRCGFTEDAIALVERLLGEESGREGKLDCLRLLFGLVYRLDPQGQRPEEIAWRIGQISNQDDEAEEGLFIITHLAATLSEKVVVDAERKTEFQRRLSAFTRKWPRSAILWAVELPENPKLADLERTLREVTGVTEEVQEQQTKLANELERGTAQIPFAWRPRQVFMNVADLPSLWEIAKQSKKDAYAYHLTMATADWRSRDPRQTLEHIPLIDLVSLLVLNDLELFPVLFELFPRVAISQGTLMALQKYSEPLSGSLAQAKCQQVINQLKYQLPKILQPSAPIPEELERSWAGDEEGVKILASDGRFMLYSDDALFRIYAEIPPQFPSPICTLDLIEAAEYQDLIPAQEAARLVGLLCRWNVGVLITQRVLFASLSEIASRARKASDALDSLQRDPTVSAIFEGIWNVRKSYGDLVGQAGNTIGALVAEKQNRLEIVSALWALWYLKAKLRRDVNVNPPIMHLVLSLVKASHQIKEGNSEGVRRLWQAYLEVVSLEFGSRMDEKHEKEAYQLVGKFIADSEGKAELASAATSLRRKLVLGLTEGTAPHSWFMDAYSNQKISNARKPAARRD